MMRDLSRRVYCDRHEDSVGDPYPPDCRACDNLTAEWAQLTRMTCPDHPWCLRPCEKGCDA